MSRHRRSRPWLAYAWLAAVVLGVIVIAVTVSRPHAPVADVKVAAPRPGYHATLPGQPPVLPAPPRPRAVPAVPARYTVRDGDTLWAIAGSHCGNPLAWNALYHANRQVIGPNADRITAGQRLILTCAYHVRG